MPLSKFIKTAVTLDIKHLIIWGTPAEPDLLVAWSNIWQEFLDGMQDKKGEQRVRLKSEIDKLDYDYRVIQLCIQRLSIGPSEWAIEQLRRRVRVPGDLNPDDPAGYFKSLIAVMNQALSLKHRQKERQAEMDIVYQRDGAGEKITYSHFDTLVTRVSLFAKFQIDRRKTMTSEFTELYRQMKRQEDALKQQLEMSKSRRA